MDLSAIMNPVRNPPSELPPQRDLVILSDFPAELLIEIAEQLSATYSLESLASFNASCRRIHQSTLPTLFRSLILVTRAPEDNVEVEKEVRVKKEEDIPKAWNHVRFLFVGKKTLDALTELGSNYRGESGTNPLETLFPRLVVVFLRTSEPENRNHDRNRRDAPASQPQPPSVTKVIRIRADVYRPVKPFALMSACVIGTHLRQTSIAGTVIQEASLDPDDAGPRHAKTIDNLYKITFQPNGKFLPQAEEDVFPFPGRVGDHPGIEIDPTTLDDDASLGSRSRDTARGIFDLLPPRSVGLGGHSILPKIKVAGTGVSFKPLLAELVDHFPVKATIEIADKKLLSLSGTIDAIKWTATRLQTRYDALAVPHEGYNQILDVRAMGAADSKTDCSWFGTLLDRHRRVGGTLANGEAVPPGIGYRQLHYFDTEREQSMVRNDWVYPAGQEGKVVLIEEMRETRTRG